ncbi:uncharacterized protein K02A2.6-like [Dendronephthya gigantea]|uniref:uncharacterized protein K02A2.6-like n=1 Tax=Dendronephthya gigantea TaxID=151771 RepID=UPI00106A3DBC|nr:uncharacterized protein K02A2.6-like [Dendronephthya gigantea]
MSIYRELKEPKGLIQTSKTSLTSYTGDKLNVVGKCMLKCMNKQLNFFVSETDQYPILGFQASQELDIIKVVMGTNKEGDFEEKYSEVFKGLGCLKEPYHIELDPEVSAVVNPARKVPVAIKGRLKLELEEMEKQGVIRKVDRPTDWVNSIAIVEKPGTGRLRICLDPKHLNEAIRWEHFQLPTVEEIASRVSGAKVFSKLDAKHGYWQIPLDEPSQLLTTFSTLFGKYCFMRMPFGIKFAQEVFQKRILQHFDDLEGVATDIDDILIWGSDEQEHDARLEATLQRCEEINLTLNLDKCKFKMNEVSYCGHIFTKDGVKPDESKIKAIQEMPTHVEEGD